MFHLEPTTLVIADHRNIPELAFEGPVELRLSSGTIDGLASVTVRPDAVNSQSRALEIQKIAEQTFLQIRVNGESVIQKDISALGADQVAVAVFFKDPEALGGLTMFFQEIPKEPPQFGNAQ